MRRIVMDKPKLVIVEAPQGGWKTTVTNNLRNKMTCSNLLRLSGGKAQSSSIPVFRYYSNLLNFISQSHNVGMNFILDRFYFSEQVYSRIGFKDYKFDAESKILSHKLQCLQSVYDIHVFLLVTEEEEYIKRLNRDKPVYEKAVFSAKSSMEQQKHYEDIFRELQLDNVTVINTTHTTSKRVTEQILRQVFNEFDEKN